MESNWWAKTAIALLLFAVSCYVLVPTFAGLPDAGSDEARPGWAAVFPEKKLKLGLDLQGGIDLSLEVDVEAAITNRAQRDVRVIKEQLEKENILVTRVERPEGTQEIVVVLQNNDDLQKMKKRIADQMGVYQFDRTEASGGEQLHHFVMKDEWRAEFSRNSVDQVMETLRNRIDQFGVAEPSIAKRGANRINIQLPGLADPERAIKLIGKTAQLEFRMVDDSMDANTLLALIDNTVTANNLPEDYTDAQLNTLLEGKIPADTLVLWQRKFDPATKTNIRQAPYLLKKEVPLTGDYIEGAQVQRDNFNMPYVAMELNRAGAKLFEDLTAANVRKQMAIVLDGTVNSAPVINEKIPGGRASIQMGSGDPASQYEEARDLALVLRAGALPAPVYIAENRTVGPSLGRDSIEQGKLSFLIGTGAVFVFAAIYYGMSGVVADLMLAFNVLLIMAALSLLQATLTLPGIAGIVLTVGMAVDANVIIYERIREELRLGRSVHAAVEEGFSKAWTAIFDANITTLIAGVVLYSYGSGPVKGFAVTLSIGILTTMYTAVTVTKLGMDLLVAKGRSNRLSI